MSTGVKAARRYLRARRVDVTRYCADCGALLRAVTDWPDPAARVARCVGCGRIEQKKGR